MNFSLYSVLKNWRYQQNIYSNKLLKYCFIEQNNMNVMEVYNFENILSLCMGMGPDLNLWFPVDYLCWHWCRGEPSRQPPGQPAWTAQTTAAVSPSLVPSTRQKRPGLLWNPIVCGGSMIDDFVGFPYPESMYPWITK